MNTDSMFILLDYVMIAYGAYALYAAWKLRGTGEIPSGVWSKDFPLSRCKDKEGFVRFFVPRLTVTGVLVLLNGILGVIGDRNKNAPVAMSIIPMVLILIVLVWYIIFTRKAQKQFF